jgi:hypothetical protein
MDEIVNFVKPNPLSGITASARKTGLENGCASDF